MGVGSGKYRLDQKDARRRDHIPGSNTALIERPEKQADVVAEICRLPYLAGGLDTVNPHAGPVVDPHLITDIQLTGLHAACRHGAAMANDKHVPDRHAKHAATLLA
jgi:hypothetical protein